MIKQLCKAEAAARRQCDPRRRGKMKKQAPLLRYTQMCSVLLGGGRNQIVMRKYVLHGFLFL